MRHLRHTVLTTLAIALCAAPATAAHPHNDHGRAAISPARGGGLTGGELLGEAWARALSGSNAAFQGTCTTLAPGVLQGHGGDDGIATCKATSHSRLFVGFGSFCSDLEDGLTTEREQLACASAVSQESLTELNVTANNFFGVPAGTPLTFTAHGWGIVVHSLRPGRHTVTLEVVHPDNSRELFITVILKVVRGGHSDDRDHGDD
jgi:hypothetical protein